MAPGMKVTGKRTSSMERGLRHGLMVQAITETILMARSMALESLLGLMEALTRDNFKRTTLRERECTSGLMAESMRENGRTTKWKEVASLPGLMADATKESTLMIRKKARALSSGLMVANTRVTGKTANNMELVSIPLPLERLRGANGTKERESLGLTDIHIYNFPH